MNRIGIYCGSFDPVHKGHIAIARACVEQDLVDEVWIIATGAYWDKNDLTPFSERIAMLKMAAKEGIVIDETYNELPYTYQIFEQLENDHPDKRFSLILGGDNLPRFDQWRNYEYLLNFDFIILPRGEIDEKEVKEIMKKFNKENYAILKLEPIAISSTFIREHLHDYEAIKDMIDKKVYDHLIGMERKKEYATRDHKSASSAG